ncbi:unnamed protein product, partial [Ixodes pacificus]
IKVCLEGSGTDLQTVIHEMGHVHYFMAYRHQPSLLRAAPLSALHEAIGECFTVFSPLRAQCTKHFVSLSLNVEKH